MIDGIVREPDDGAATNPELAIELVERRSSPTSTSCAATTRGSSFATATGGSVTSVTSTSPSRRGRDGWGAGSAQGPRQRRAPRVATRPTAAPHSMHRGERKSAPYAWQVAVRHRQAATLLEQPVIRWRHESQAIGGPHHGGANSVSCRVSSDVLGTRMRHIRSPRRGTCHVDGGRHASEGRRPQVVADPDRVQ